MVFGGHGTRVEGGRGTATRYTFCLSLYILFIIIHFVYQARDTAGRQQCAALAAAQEVAQQRIADLTRELAVLYILFIIIHFVYHCTC